MNPTPLVYNPAPRQHRRMAGGPRRGARVRGAPAADGRGRRHRHGGRLPPRPHGAAVAVHSRLAGSLRMGAALLRLLL